MLRKINTDFYFVSRNLKKLYKNYQVFFNFNLKTFEVFEMLPFNKKRFCFSVGKNLNNKALKKAVETSVKNATSIFKNIEKHNKKLEDKKEERIKDYSRDELASLLDYANTKNCDVDFSRINLTRWI